jgi:DNA-binding HxlR family transcriptional regulator
LRKQRYMKSDVPGVESPRPGTPVRGSTSGRPIMAVLDLLGRRWALRILWELLVRPAGFRDLQARCGGISASVLSTRLQELSHAIIVEGDAAGKWRLTRLGEELVDALVGLNAWSAKWAVRLEHQTVRPRFSRRSEKSARPNRDT